MLGGNHFPRRFNLEQKIITVASNELIKKPAFINNNHHKLRRMLIFFQKGTRTDILALYYDMQSFASFRSNKLDTKV